MISEQSLLQTTKWTCTENQAGNRGCTARRRNALTIPSEQVIPEFQHYIIHLTQIRVVTALCP